MQNRPHSGKDWVILPAPPHWATVSAVCPLRIVSLFSIVLWVSWIQALLVFRAIYFWGLSLRRSIKSWGDRYEVWTLLSLQKSWELRVPSWLYGTVPAMGFSVRDCLSLFYLFWCRCYIIHPMCRSCSVSFWISFRGNCFTHMCSCTLGMSIEGGELKSLPMLPSLKTTHSVFLDIGHSGSIFLRCYVLACIFFF